MIWTCLNSSFGNKAIVSFKLWEERWVLWILKKEKKKRKQASLYYFQMQKPSTKSAGTLSQEWI